MSLFSKVQWVTIKRNIKFIFMNNREIILNRLCFVEKSIRRIFYELKNKNKQNQIHPFDNGRTGWNGIGDVLTSKRCLEFLVRREHSSSHSYISEKRISIPFAMTYVLFRLCRKSISRRTPAICYFINDFPLMLSVWNFTLAQISHTKKCLIWSKREIHGENFGKIRLYDACPKRASRICIRKRAKRRANIAWLHRLLGFSPSVLSQTRQQWEMTARSENPPWKSPIQIRTQKSKGALGKSGKTGYLTGKSRIASLKANFFSDSGWESEKSLSALFSKQ